MEVRQQNQIMLQTLEAVLANILEFPALDTVCPGIPSFFPRSEAEQALDKYDKDWIYVNRYTGLAYGFKSSLWNRGIGMGGTEGLYRTVNHFLSLSLQRDAQQAILDLGCGVGRTIYDSAPCFASSLFIGMDFSYKMCMRAHQILVDGATVALDGPPEENLDDHWPGRGYPSLVFNESKTLENVKIMQGSATHLPFKDESFECVVSTLLIDRVRDKSLTPPEDIEVAIEQMIRVLKKDGSLVLSTPLNFSRLTDWLKFKEPEGLVSHIEAHGITIHEKFDGLVYREIQDARGNYQDWLVLCVYGRKRG
jgi:SAM-dependent methyltransferase